MSSDTNPYALPRPQLTWEADGAPRSEAFGDIYFSRAGGADETDYVFLQQNRLRERWQALDPSDAGTFTITETGFGTGLNFLAAAALWLTTAPPGWRLHFVSVEQFPLNRAELTQALTAWPQYRELAAELVAVYPPLLAGFHRRVLADGRIHLQLLFGDANDCLPQLLDGLADLDSGWAADAWFLDGFAPARNPTLWSSQVLACVGRLSAAGTTVATFTAAGNVRRGLQQAGFVVQKVPGYAGKREMVRGVHSGEPPALPADLPAPRPLDYWAWPPAARARQPVIVIGGGLAGTSTARALAERGFAVTLLDAAPTLAAGASGNPRGVVYTKLSHQAGTVARFALTSWLHALAHYRRGFAHDWWPAASGDFCGVLQLTDAATRDRLQAVFHDQPWVEFPDPAATSARAGVATDQPALFFPEAGWLAPAAICAGYVDHPLITVHCNTPAQTLQQQGSGWRVTTPAGTFEAGIVVIATAHASLRLAPCDALPLKSIRGQITLLPPAALRATPRTVICHDGYLAPLADGGVCIGATFDLRDDDPQPRAASDAANIAALNRALPDLLTEETAAAGSAAVTTASRVGFRCTTPDYLPLVGAMPDIAQMQAQFTALRGQQPAADAAGAWLPGLYVNVGHGSKGLSSTPLCAELLAAIISGEVRPLPTDLMQALSPARFALRDLIRGRR